MQFSDSDKKLSNKDIKLIRSLSQKKFRTESGLFVVEGEKLVAEALDSDFEVVSVYRKSEIGDDAMKKISSLSTPSPILAVVRRREYSLEDIISGPVPHSHSTNEIIVALDGVSDPGNLGTIIRLCDWFGVKAVIASHNSVELYNPKTVQATMGSIFRVPVIYCDLAETLGEFGKAGYALYGTLLDGSPIGLENVSAIQSQCGSSIIVMGSESFGISHEIRDLIPASNRLLIPPYNPDSHSESLNVATATAIILSFFRLK